MGETDSEERSAPRKAIDAVTPSYLGRPDREMDTVGWGLFLGLLVVLVPFLPFVLIVVVLSKVVDFLRSQTRRRV